MASPAWIDRVHVITTPEAVDFAYDVAGPGQRALAWLVDGFIISVLMIGAAIFAAVIGVQAWFFITSFALQTGYFVVLEAWMHGQTPGKRIFGLRVLDSRGFRISFAQSALRNILRIADSLPFFYLVGGGVALCNRRGLRLGDLAAGTIVVRVPPVPAPERILPAGQRSDAMLGDFALAERVRRVLKSPEKDLLVSLAVRRERLEPRPRMEVFEAAAAWFAERLEIPRPSTMSAETYILNLAAIAHAPRRRTEMPKVR